MTAATAKASVPSKGGSKGRGVFQDKEKPTHVSSTLTPLYIPVQFMNVIFQIRLSNIEAAKAVADAVRTSLGPKGMDKMIKDDKVRLGFVSSDK